MRLRVSRTAERELDDIFVYWAKRAGLEIADKLVASIEEHLALLAERPNLGRKCDHLAPGVRCFPVGKYLIYFRKSRSSLDILHVFHGARNQSSAIRKS